MRHRKKTRIAVLASGSGTNLQAMIDAVRSRKLKRVEIVLVVSDKAGAGALSRARQAGLTSVFIHPPGFRSLRTFELELVRHLKADKVELIVLAGFMRILSARFVRRYESRILNIHPALLPSFKGPYAIRDALEQGVKVTGVTVHFVTADLDAGPVILQEALNILPHDNKETLLRRIHRVEHRLYPKAVQLVVDGRTRVKNGKVFIR